MLKRTKADQKALDDGCFWDEDAGQKVIRFVEKYVRLKTGDKIKLLPWQVEFIRYCYCWRRADGRRRFKTLFLTVSRRQGKSTLIAALTLYHLLADGEMSPEIASAATTRDQAAIIYKTLEWSIQNSQTLRECLHCVPSKKIIKYPKMNGRYISLSADAKSAYGHGHSLVVVDELSMHINDNLFTALNDSTDDCPDGLKIVISSAGWNKNGKFYTLYTYAKKIIAGEELDITFAPYIYETPEDADLDKEESWRLSNPSLGTTQSVVDFAAAWHTAQFDSSSKLAFQRLRLNMWTEAENVWIPLEKWDACKGTIPTFTKSSPVYVAADLGATRDLTAVACVFPFAGKYFCTTHAFVPESAVEKREKMNLVNYQNFTRDGGLEVTRGESTDFVRLKAYLQEIAGKYRVVSATWCAWEAMQLMNELMAEDWTVFKFPQYHSYFNEPTKALERLVLEGKVVHDGNACLRWQVGHTFLDIDSKGLVKPMTASDHQKKDCLVALVMAMSQAIQHESLEAAGTSVYETRGILTI